ncbi:hypothetical protein ABVK25_012266 [Lepraria finkii]|uniref:Uncharacterized protein n=1 Tax=Lepraria finkii TaxID=1340010 RepID=A0ABR4AFM7_9LECA
MQSDHQELQEKLKSINEEKERDLRDADRRHAQQLKEAASKLEQQAKNIEEDLRRTIASQAQELEGANKRLDSQLESSGLRETKGLDDLRSKHLQELELSKQRKLNPTMK